MYLCLSKGTYFFSYSTHRVFPLTPNIPDASRTTEGCSAHRISIPYRRNLFFTPNASENASRTGGGLFEHGTHIPYHSRPSPVPNATSKAKNEKSIACSECHKAKKEKGIACNESHKRQKGEDCPQRMPQLPEKRASAKRVARLAGENKKRTTSKSFSFQFGVRCGARTHDTQNHNLVLYQLN